MRAKVLVEYHGHNIGDIIDVEKSDQGYNYTGPITSEKRNAYFYPPELELLPDDPDGQSAAGGPVGATTMRTFDTGATRSDDAGKLDYEGFLSPLVLERYARYLNKHRVQADGKLRDSDNWQKGMGKVVYMKSAWRHFMDWWRNHRYHLSGVIISPAEDDVFQDAICAVLFNTMGYLHERIKEQTRRTGRQGGPDE
jgi:hypothetical protein